MVDASKEMRFIKAIAPLSPYPLVAISRFEPAAHAEQNECYDNVLRHVEIHGGKIQYGYLFSGRLEDHHVIAYGHAVWHDTRDGLVEITLRLPLPELPDYVQTPLFDAQGRLLFLPHDEGEKPSRYLPLTKNKRVIKECHRVNRELYAEYQEPGAVARRIDAMNKALGL
jgi:hypothetical protein